MEKLFEYIENIRLVEWVETKDNESTSSFEEFVREEGFSMNELKYLQKV